MALASQWYGDEKVVNGFGRASFRIWDARLATPMAQSALYQVMLAAVVFEQWASQCYKAIPRDFAADEHADTARVIKIGQSSAGVCWSTEG